MGSIASLLSRRPHSPLARPNHIVHASISFPGANSRPGFHGVPSAGSSQRSRPIQPEVLHASTSHVAIAKSRPLVDAEPAMMKFQFMKPPKNAAAAVKAPKTSATPIKSSLNSTTFENHV